MVSRDDVACKQRCKERKGGGGRVRCYEGTCHSETQGFFSFLSWCSCTVSVTARRSVSPVLNVPTTSMRWPTFTI